MSKRKIPEEDYFHRIAESAPLACEPDKASAKLKSRIYSMLTRHQAAAGGLASFTDSKAAGYGLCVFEELVRIAPVGETAKQWNICRVCHARVLAENLEKAPIYWPHCPYSEFQKS